MERQIYRQIHTQKDRQIDRNRSTIVLMTKYKKYSDIYMYNRVERYIDGKQERQIDNTKSTIVFQTKHKKYTYLQIYKRIDRWKAREIERQKEIDVYRQNKKYYCPHVKTNHNYKDTQLVFYQ